METVERKRPKVNGPRPAGPMPWRAETKATIGMTKQDGRRHLALHLWLLSMERAASVTAIGRKSRQLNGMAGWRILTVMRWAASLKPKKISLKINEFQRSQMAMQ